MNFLPFVLAERSMLREFGSGFRDRSEHFELVDLWPWALGAALLIGGLFALQRWLTHNDGQTFYHSPRALMRSLCQAHGITRAEHRLLLLIARARGVAMPACLFLDPEAFEVSDVSSIDLARHADAIAAIKARLFASDAIAAAADASDAATAPGDASETQATPGEAPAAETHAAEAGQELQPTATDQVADDSRFDGDDKSERGQRGEHGSRGEHGESPAGPADRTESRLAQNWAPAQVEPAAGTTTAASALASAASNSRGWRSEEATRNENVGGASEDRATTFTEQQAVRALETLMRQINANRTPTPTPATSSPTATPVIAPAPNMPASNMPVSFTDTPTANS